MAVRLRKKWFSGELGSDTDLNSLPGGWYSYSEYTADVSTGASAEQILSRSITVDANRLVMVTVSYRVSCDDSGAFVSLILKRDGNIINYPCRFTAPAADAQDAGTFIHYDALTVPDTYLYSVDLIRTDGTGLVWLQASTDGPFQLGTVDVGSL